MDRISANDHGHAAKAATAWAIVLLVFMTLSGASCSGKPPVAELRHQESILDRIVHIEPKLVSPVPEVPRWCESIAGLETRRIDVGGASLHVELEGRGVPFVLINGGPGGTHHDFHPWFSRANGYARVVYYDQRGCGLSDFSPGEKGYSVEQAVEDLDALRKALGFKKWVVLGYSYGGFLAQLYAVHHPENVSGLILLGASTGLNVDDGPSRQGDYLSEAEKKRLEEVRGEVNAYAESHRLSRQDRLAVLIYNNNLNGDWKRQNFFKPGPEDMARAARYGWVNDRDFNGVLNRSEGYWDLGGAFQGCPIPTLILEGRYDLTWSEKKKDMIKGNHPGAWMVVFENAGHGIYDEQPGEFFRVLNGFISGLPRVDVAALERYRAFLAGWLDKARPRPELFAVYDDWGPTASRKLAFGYSPEILAGIDRWERCLRTGFALYDVGRYADALTVFDRLETKFGGESKIRAMALIWQGHMLDLSGGRVEALAHYRRAADMELTDILTNSQYGLKYEISAYARQRLRTPFARLENRISD